LTGGDGASSPLTPSAFVAGRALVSLPFLYFLARSDPKSFAELRAEFSALLSSSSVLVLGALNCLGQLLLAHGLAWSSVGNAVVIGQLVAVYSCTIAVFQGVEKASAGKFLAIGAGVLGAAVMLDPANMWLTRGNLALLARAAVFAAYLALQAPVLRAYRPVTVACAAQLIGAVGAICVGLPSAFGELDFSSSVSPGTSPPNAGWLRAHASGFSGVHLARLVAVAALSSAAYALTAEAEKHVTPVVTACYNSLQPVMALIVACALGDVPGFRELTGSALIVFGGVFAVALGTDDRARWKQSYPVGDFGVDRNSPRTRTYRRAEDDASDGSSPSKTVSKTVRGGGRSDGRTRERLRAIDRSSAAGRRAESSRESPGSAETRTGTVRIARPAPTRRPEARAVAWTVAWALVMSLCALAGGGLLTWSLVYLYWKFVV
jgi:drug/metabolite transporter (DMT)-like permease